METNKRNRCKDCSKFGWGEPANVLPESAFNFSQETSLHGVKYICQSKRHFCERIFWLITFIGGGIAAGLLIGKLWVEYSHKPIITFSSKETTIEQIPYPAVTIYNSNQVRRSDLEYVLLVLTSLNYTLSKHQYNFFTGLAVARYICNYETTFGEKMNFTYAKDSRNVQLILDHLEDIFQLMSLHYEKSGTVDFSYSLLMSHRCHHMIKKCQFNDNAVNCEEQFDEEIAGGKQSFCSFNLIDRHTFTSNKEELLHDLNTINETTLVNRQKYEYRNLFWFNDLIKRDGLLLHNRLDAADAVAPGNVSEKNNWYMPKRQRNSGKSGGLSVILDPELHEYVCGLTNSEGFLLQVHPPTDLPNGKEKGIFIKPNTEVSVEVTPKVTLANPNLKNIPVEYRNCYFQNEKHLKTSWYYTLDICIDECIYNITKVECNCDLTRSFRTSCTSENFTCAMDIIKQMSRNEYAAKCRCLPLCTTVEYTTSVSSAEIDSGHLMMSDTDLVNDENGTVFNKRKKNNLSIVHVYFVDDYVYAVERKQMYGWVDFVANAGGVLGLCLGFSVLSLLEGFYFLTFRLCCQSRRRKTVSEIATINKTRLFQRNRQTVDVPEYRQIQLEFDKLSEELKTLPERLTKCELATEATDPVLN